MKRKTSCETLDNDYEEAAEVRKRSCYSRQTCPVRAKLRQMFESFNYYSKGNKTSPASEVSLKLLQHGVMNSSSNGNSVICTLCLESLQEGEELTILPCGHIFHKGGSKRKVNRSGKCQGIKEWLRSSCACPTCRHELAPKYKKPTNEEYILIPIIKRQNAIIKLQEELLGSLKTKVENLDEFDTTFPSMKQEMSIAKEEKLAIPMEIQKSVRKQILYTIVGTLGNRIILNIKNLETLSKVAAKIEKQLLSETVVTASQLKPATLKKLVLDHLKLIAPLG